MELIRLSKWDGKIKLIHWYWQILI